MVVSRRHWCTCRRCCIIFILLEVVDECISYLPILLLPLLHIPLRSCPDPEVGIVASATCIIPFPALGFANDRLLLLVEICLLVVCFCHSFLPIISQHQDPHVDDARAPDNLLQAGLGINAYCMFLRRLPFYLINGFRTVLANMKRSYLDLF